MRRLFTVLAAAVLLLTACAPGEGDASRLCPHILCRCGAERPGDLYLYRQPGEYRGAGAAPKRVAALLGSYAETWLLAGGEVAAVTQDAYDERGLELPEDTVNLGANQQPDLEALLAAEPDLVLLTPDLDGQMGLKDSLAAAGIPAAWFKVETFDDYLNMLKICTDLTGRSDLYQKNGLDIQSGIDAAIASVPEGEDPTVLLLRAYSSGVRAKNSRQHCRGHAEGPGGGEHRRQQQRACWRTSRWNPSWPPTQSSSLSPPWGPVRRPPSRAWTSCSTATRPGRPSPQ